MNMYLIFLIIFMAGINITVLRTFGASSEFRCYKYCAALPLVVLLRQKMQVRSTDNLCSNDAPRENAGAEHRKICRINVRSAKMVGAEHRNIKRLQIINQLFIN